MFKLTLNYIADRFLGNQVDTYWKTVTCESKTSCIIKLTKYLPSHSLNNAVLDSDRVYWNVASPVEEHTLIKNMNCEAKLKWT